MAIRLSEVNAGQNVCVGMRTTRGQRSANAGQPAPVRRRQGPTSGGVRLSDVQGSPESSQLGDLVLLVE